MEDDLNFFKNGRQSQFSQKWKTISIFRKMEDDLIIPPPPLLKSKPNPAILGLSTAQVMSFCSIMSLPLAAMFMLQPQSFVPVF
jgi:hypothetical protein